MKTIKIYSGYEKAKMKLYFINMLNNAGCHNKPLKFKTYFDAANASPMLKSICDKLKPSELDSLINRIENLL